MEALREYIVPYADDNNILVYCGATNVIDEKADSSNTDDEDIRQIEAVTRILGNEFQQGRRFHKKTKDILKCIN